jgi:hypothetical protein
MDGCGCAAGPETYTWYRFNRRVFSPTTPPGPSPGCIVTALDAAKPVLGAPWIVGPPGRLSAPFRVTKFACLDGWALANDASGRLALFNQQSSLWFRSSVGSLTRIERDTRYFALPRSLIERLEHTLARR